MKNTDQYILIYDGSFEGFLSCVFEVFERKMDKVTVTKVGAKVGNLFSVEHQVVTNDQHANRVWKGLKKRLHTRELQRLYAAFLSERSEVEDLLLYYIRRAFESDVIVTGDYGDPAVLKIAQFAKNVGREAHRMEAFVRFKLTSDGIYFANIAPDFDVIPLISEHFEKRYADQRWVIYDLTRKYGIYYDLNKVETIELSLSTSSGVDQAEPIFDPSEMEFQQLWKDYFQSTNIKERKNMRLHVRHVPRRYWRYLSEKGGEK
ncbi:MAG: TIGR03915 family putative DNA repair protein [Cyclobacteriaceae bacterium]